MKALFDTSTLVAALLGKHPHHSSAFARLLAVHRGNLDGVLTTHGLAELFATLTALPLKPRLQPAEVEKLIERSIIPWFELLSLTAAHYKDAIALTVRSGMASGAIYDALHLVGARVSNCNALLTFDTRHFGFLAPGDPIIVHP